jgi:hypothetical protein
MKRERRRLPHFKTEISYESLYEYLEKNEVTYPTYFAEGGENVREGEKDLEFAIKTYLDNREAHGRFLDAVVALRFPRRDRPGEILSRLSTATASIPVIATSQIVFKNTYNRSVAIEKRFKEYFEGKLVRDFAQLRTIYISLLPHSLLFSTLVAELHPAAPELLAKLMEEQSPLAVYEQFTQSAESLEAGRVSLVTGLTLLNLLPVEEEERGEVIQQKITLICAAIEAERELNYDLLRRGILEVLSHAKLRVDLDTLRSTQAPDLYSLISEALISLIQGLAIGVKDGRVEEGWFDTLGQLKQALNVKYLSLLAILCAYLERTTLINLFNEFITANLSEITSDVIKILQSKHERELILSEELDRIFEGRNLEYSSELSLAEAAEIILEGGQSSVLPFDFSDQALKGLRFKGKLEIDAGEQAIILDLTLYDRTRNFSLHLDPYLAWTLEPEFFRLRLVGAGVSDRAITILSNAVRKVVVDKAMQKIKLSRNQAQAKDAPLPVAAPIPKRPLLSREERMDLYDLMRGQQPRKRFKQHPAANEVEATNSDEAIAQEGGRAREISVIMDLQTINHLLTEAKIQQTVITAEELYDFIARQVVSANVGNSRIGEDVEGVAKGLTIRQLERRIDSHALRIYLLKRGNATFELVGLLYKKNLAEQNRYIQKLNEKYM